MRLSQLRRLNRPDRPWVVFPAGSEKQAKRLYRTQHLIWIWLGLTALLSMLEYFFRPHLGPALVSPSQVLDLTRVILFGLGGCLITFGVWNVYRVAEILGHLLFASGATLTAVATGLTVHPGVVPALVAIGIGFASAFRVYFLLRWIGAPRVPGGH